MAPPSKLAVASSVVQRLVKEEASYHKEQVRQEERIKKLEEDQSEENAEYMLKQEVCLRYCRHVTWYKTSDSWQRTGLDETIRMYPYLRTRINEAVVALKSQIVC